MPLGLVSQDARLSENSYSRCKDGLNSLIFQTFPHFFVRFQTFSYLCLRESVVNIIMKEIDENKDEQSMMASEPVGAALRADASTIGYDIDNWPGMPLVGPSNLEEMNTRIDQAEQEINEGIGFSWEQVMSDAQSIVSRYETAVY